MSGCRKGTVRLNCHAHGCIRGGGLGQLDNGMQFPGRRERDYDGVDRTPHSQCDLSSARPWCRCYTRRATLPPHS